jgi:hypothetical protein
MTNDKMDDLDLLRDEIFMVDGAALQGLYPTD